MPLPLAVHMAHIYTWLNIYIWLSSIVYLVLAWLIHSISIIMQYCMKDENDIFKK